jgi:hypothetical protein
MTELYGHVLETIFLRFIRRDTLILQRIDAFEGDLKVHGESLVFTLPALYEFASRSYETTSGQAVSNSRKGYLRFRKALYQNPTNSRLIELGGRVELEAPNPNPNHDLVHFRLVRKGEASC